MFKPNIVYGPFQVYLCSNHIYICIHIYIYIQRLLEWYVYGPFHTIQKSLWNSTRFRWEGLHGLLGGDGDVGRIRLNKEKPLDLRKTKRTQARRIVFGFKPLWNVKEIRNSWIQWEFGPEMFLGFIPWNNKDGGTKFMIDSFDPRRVRMEKNSSFRTL